MEGLSIGAYTRGSYRSTSHQVCTKVASFLEQGQRLENLSWRLWHLQNLIVETDNAKSKREFRKLSKVMGDKLDKEKGR
jgi:GATA-binding protein, other eukaryote